MNKRRFIAVIGAATLIVGAAAAAEPASEFTTTDPKKCKLLFEGKGDFGYSCPGMGGYGVVFKSFSGDSWVNVVYDSEEIDLKAATVSACPGEFPHKSNHIVQWRGYRKGGKFMPYAMIYRMTSDVNGKSVETLVVVQLSGSGSRVIGSVPSNKGGNEGAEKLADKECSHLVDP